MSEPLSALPSVRARIIAFVAIMVCGALGGLIGFWFGGLTDESTLTTGGLMVVGTLVFSLGAAAVGVISLRTVAEWSTTPAARGEEPTPVEQLRRRGGRTAPR